jgi:hypothetical protein
MGKRRLGWSTGRRPPKARAVLPARGFFLPKEQVKFPKIAANSR